MPYRRLLSLLLVLLLLPVSCLGEAYSFELTFSSAPAQPGSSLEGILDLLKMTKATGEVRINDDPSLGFDSTLSLILDEDEATRLDFRLYGVQALFHLFSPLWNDMDLLVNVPAMLEFGMKIYQHMNIPLQRVFILYPYLTREAIRRVLGTFKDTLMQGDRTVQADELEFLGNELVSQLYNERSFRIWMDVMGSLNESGSQLSSLWEAWPVYLTEQIGSIVCEKTDTSISWTRGSDGMVLFQDTWDGLGNDTIRIRMPGFLYGSDAALDYVRTAHDDCYDVDMTFNIGEGEDLLLSGTVESRDIPGHLPVRKDFSCSMNFQGPLLQSLTYLAFGANGLLETATLKDTLEIRLQGGPEGVSLLSGDKEMLTLHFLAGEIPMGEPPEHSVYEFREGFEIFSLNDSSLHELVEQAKDHVIEKGIPIIYHAPVTTVASLMDILQDAGILDMLASGLSSEEEEDESWEEEDWGEEEEDSWDEEDEE